MQDIYRKLLMHFGPQGWWPAQSAFEVIVGAILTQNTNWSNVEQALFRLKKAGVLHPAKLAALGPSRIASLIRPSGYYNVKARRLRGFLEFLRREYGNSLKKLGALEPAVLRSKLLSIDGIGPETADSIALYAFEKPVFVIDAYTRRILARHGFIKESDSYAQVQDMMMRSLRHDVRMFNEYHALFVRLAKEYCRKNNPRCAQCPLEEYL